MAASAQKIEANRANAQKSTGPKSASGKAASSRNALKHGLTSQDLVIRPGHQEEFDDLVASLNGDFHPETPAETVLFQQIVAAVWRLLRCDRVEAELALRTSEPDPLLDPALQPTLRTLAMVRGQALKQQRAATTELRAMQSERIYRASIYPQEEVRGENRQFGLATLRTLYGKIQDQLDKNLKAAFNAPPPGADHLCKNEPTDYDPALEAEQRRLIKEFQKMYRG
jgi:hypothetical protein